MRKNKCAATDFDIQALPHNRVEMFFDCIKMRYGTLCILGLICLVFLIPLLAVYFYKDLATNSIIVQINNGLMVEEDAYALRIKITNFTNLLAIVFYMVFGLGVSGVCAIIKKLIWGEPIFASDYKDGIKSNGGHYILVFLIFGVSVFSSSFIANMAKNSTIITILPWAIFGIVILPVLLLILSQTLVYTSKMGECIKNGFTLYLKTLPTILLAEITLFLPLLFQLISNVFIKYGCLIVYIILIFPLNLLGWLLYNMAIFDKHINRFSFPAFLRKGLLPPTK